VTDGGRAARARAAAVTVLRAPVAARTWREFGYSVASLVLAVPAFALALAGLVSCALSLLTVGLLLLVVVLTLARRTVRYFRLPARALLGWDWPDAPPVTGRGPLRWGRAMVGNGPAWRALVYCFAKLPVAAVAAYGGAVLIASGTLAALSPVLWLIDHDEFGPWSIHSWAATWPLAAQGVAAVLVFPWFVRLLVGLDRLLVAALLGPNRDRARIEALEASRTALTADSVAVLRRLERDLHDGTQSRLLAVGVALNRIERRVEPGETRDLVIAARATVTDALAELRDIVRGIHPPALDDGLETALTTLASRASLPVTFTAQLSVRPSDATASALYFTAAELLSNITRHAGATRAALTLRADDASVRLRVTDDGKGGARVSAAGTGLAGLARRAAALDGSMEIDSAPGGPTTVTVTLPAAS
jgi:signal transduction histidine kinase